jgi:hypothetical protein
MAGNHHQHPGYHSQQQQQPSAFIHELIGFWKADASVFNQSSGAEWEMHMPSASVAWRAGLLPQSTASAWCCEDKVT